MKQYTTTDQTAKLIELGLEKPSPSFYRNGVTWIQCEGNYSVGELLSFLPENIAKENEIPSTLNISLLNGEWCVEYADFLGADFSFSSVELIDAIFNMIEKLKENEVI